MLLPRVCDAKQTPISDVMQIKQNTCGKYSKGKGKALNLGPERFKTMQHLKLDRKGLDREQKLYRMIV